MTVSRSEDLSAEPFYRPCESGVLIHRENLVHNLRAVRSVIPPGTAVCGSVKANAYGHGVKEVSEILRAEGVEYLGVANVTEGLEIRSFGDSGRIILYGTHTPEQIRLCVQANLEPMITDRAQLDALIGEISESKKSSFGVHLKIDTGMGRAGCLPADAIALAEKISGSEQLRLAGLATHFPVADSESREDREYTRGQFAMLNSIAENLRSRGMDPGIIHAANSGGIALHNGFGEKSGMVRPGIVLYGYGPKLPVKEAQKPVMEWRTNVAALKKIPKGSTVSYGRTWTAEQDTWIAVLPVGYADGYFRSLSNRAEVLIGGQRYPIAGTVCMDQFMVNLGFSTKVKVGDPVTLFGPDKAGPDAEELASLCGTISYEITCSAGMRNRR